MGSLNLHFLGWATLRIKFLALKEITRNLCILKASESNNSIFFPFLIESLYILFLCLSSSDKHSASSCKFYICF